MAYTTIDKPTDYFNTVTWTGNGSSSRNITGVGFQPDWVWGKCRNATVSHALYDSVRGGSKLLNSNATSAEGTNAALSAFVSDGFSVNSDSYFNANSNTYVAWNWLAGGSASSNSDGGITTSVSANTTSGFSIVSYTGTGSNATVGHGLGVAPKVLILKSRTRSDGQWSVGSDMLGWTKFLYLDATSAEQTFNIYQDTAPTSSVFYLSSDGGVNQSSGNMIGYAFAEKKGYSKFGKYTGNGNADGSYIHLGFRPAWLLVKKSSASGSDWNLHHNKSPGFNVNDNYLAPNENAAEVTNNSYQIFDLLSNGFKCRGTGTGTNGSGATYIYMAFAESPFVTSTGIPTTAR